MQDQANVAEASQQAIVQKLQAEASTQFAGTGAVINIYGLPASNAAAIADAVDWVARTQLQVAA